MSSKNIQQVSKVSASSSKTSPSMSLRMVCRYLLVALLISMAFYDVASAASKKFIKGFILGALLAKNNHYPVVVHEHSKHKYWVFNDVNLSLDFTDFPIKKPGYYI